MYGSNTICFLCGFAWALFFRFMRVRVSGVSARVGGKIGGVLFCPGEGLLHNVIYFNVSQVFIQIFRYKTTMALLRFVFAAEQTGPVENGS